MKSPDFLSTQSCSSPHPVLPPIITNEKDRIFLSDVNNYIEKELADVYIDDKDDRFAVFRVAFDKIIEYVTSYRPILTAIKSEYEEVIDTIIRGKQEAFFLNGKLKALSSEPSTMRNYKRRLDELEQRISIIKENNKGFKDELVKLHKEKNERESRIKDMLQPPDLEIKRDKRRIPGLTMEQNTDLELLQKEIIKVEKQLSNLKEAEKCKYQPKDVKESIEIQLLAKMEQKEKLKKDVDDLKNKIVNLSIVLDAAKAFNNVQPPNATIGDAVLAAVKAHLRGEPTSGNGSLSDDLIQQRDQSILSLDDDDPAKEREAEMITDYVEKFHELFDGQKYEAAAIHAANSPKEMLRTMETLWKFKMAKQLPGDRPPLLAFSDAIMSSVMAVKSVPSNDICLECVQCALDNNRIDMVSHWISQERVRVSENIADMICTYCRCPAVCNCGCHAAAQRIYTGVKCHKNAVVCMLKQSRIKQAMEYSRSKANFDQIDYIDILRRCPSPLLIRTLIYRTEDTEPVLSIGTVTRILSETPHFRMGFELLNNVLDNEEGSDLLHKEVLMDLTMSEDDWLSIVNACRNNGFEELSIEILAAVTVTTAMRTAAKMIDISEVSI